MVRRKKHRTGNAVAPAGASPIVRVVQLGDEDLAGASVDFTFARAYTPESLREHYGNDFERSVIVRVDAVPHTATNSCSLPVYVGYVLGLLGDVDDLLVVEDDSDGALTSALAHHGARVLFDDFRVENGRVAGRGIGDKLDCSISPLLDLSSFRFQPTWKNAQPKLVYEGPLPDKALDGIFTCLFFANVYEKEPVLAKAVDEIYASIGRNIEVEGYKTQFLYAASFGKFDDVEIEACRAAHTLTYGEMKLYRFLMDNVDKSRWENTPKAAEFAYNIKAIDAVCDIWLKGLAETAGRGDDVTIANDAVAMIDGGEGVIEEHISNWRGFDISDPHAKDVVTMVLACGLACGIDFMVDSYMSGVPLEHILEEG